MRNVCLSLPTNRECKETIKLLAYEAEYANKNFDINIKLLILDTSTKEIAQDNQSVLQSLKNELSIEIIYLNENEQDKFISDIVKNSGVEKPEKAIYLMSPKGVSYGACTNRAFLISSAMGCDILLRRDSDSRYQKLSNNYIFPIENELIALGIKAKDIIDKVNSSSLTHKQELMPISLVGGSFIGEMSVDISELKELSPSAYSKVVGLWAPTGSTEEEKKSLVDVSFTGGGTTRFTKDHKCLGTSDPMKIDMCNVGFYKVHQHIPLPPGEETTGSDYFLLHFVKSSTLPGISHNRHIENFYTPVRKTDDGFKKSQLRFCKFLISMPYLYSIYESMEKYGSNIINEEYEPRVELIKSFIDKSILINENVCNEKIEILINEYEKLGGRYEKFATDLKEKKVSLLNEVKEDFKNFSYLVSIWPNLISTALNR